MSEDELEYEITRLNCAVLVLGVSVFSLALFAIGLTITLIHARVI